jgi:hypothetical protein
MQRVGALVKTGASKGSGAVSGASVAVVIVTVSANIAGVRGIV